MNPGAWIADLWKSASASLKKLMAASALVFVGVTAYLMWTSGYTVSRMGGMLTREDLALQTDTLQASTQDIADQMNHALASYDDSLKAYLRAERKLAVDTTLKPLLKLVFSVKSEVQQLQALQRTTQSRVSELPAAYEGALRNLIEEKPPSRTDALLEELLDRQRRTEQQLDTLMKTRTRNSKVKM